MKSENNWKGHEKRYGTTKGRRTKVSRFPGEGGARRHTLQQMESKNGWRHPHFTRREMKGKKNTNKKGKKG